MNKENKCILLTLFLVAKLFGIRCFIEFQRINNLAKGSEGRSIDVSKSTASDSRCRFMFFQQKSYVFEKEAWWCVCRFHFFIPVVLSVNIMSKVFSDDQKKMLQKMMSNRTSVTKPQKKDNDEDLGFKRSPKKRRLQQQDKKTVEKKMAKVTDQPVDRSTKLSEAARNRLSMSQFRSMNEKLYKTFSQEAVMLMDPDSFSKYHEAYSEIASKWPVKPIDHLIKKIQKLYGKERLNKGDLVLSDMGCGNKPLIAIAFPSCQVHSFDLICTDERITPCSISNIPLKNQSVDCVVFSLSLMPKDLGRVLKEAARIVKERGHVLIAEVASRFEPEAGQTTDTIKTFSEKLNKFFGLKQKSLEKLPPNGFFIVFDFIKTGIKSEEKTSDKSKDSSSLPFISLKACEYKPR